MSCTYTYIQVCKHVQVWLDKVVGVVPDIGFPVQGHGLWMEAVDGRCCSYDTHKSEIYLLP